MGEPRSLLGQVPQTFIGRDAELAELSAGVEDALRGRGRLYLITGEPGIGKTALAEHLAARARDRGMRVLWGQCWEGAGAPAYWPWVQALRPLIDEHTDSPSRRKPDVEHLAELLPDPLQAAEGAPVPQPAGARFRLFAAVSGLLTRAAETHPLLVLLDDLHAADPASFLLLRFVVGDLRNAPVLIAATYRATEAMQRADVVEALGSLVRDGTGLVLRGFARRDVQQYVERLASTPPSEDDVARIHRATGGNPLFIRELVRLAGMEAASGRGGSRDVPQSVRAVIHQRLASLDAAAIHILSVAAVVGHDFEAPLIVDVTGLDAAYVLQTLALAEQHELLTRVPDTPATLRFSHGLVREVLHDDLPVAVRRELHGKVGSVIERRAGADLPARLGELAFHFTHAGNAETDARAAAYARMAGDHALQAYAYEEAALQYQRAFDAARAAPAPDEARQCDLLLCLGDAQARAGNYREAKGTFLRAAEIARRLGTPEKFARAALGFGEPQVEGGIVDPQLVSLLREALERLSSDNSALRARVLARWSLELTFADTVELRQTLRGLLSREALEMARRVGEVEALAIALRARWLAVWGPDELDERVALAEELLDLARSTGDRETEIVARARRITGWMELGDMRALEADSAIHSRLAAELRMPYHEWAAATIRVGRALMTGSPGAAEGMAQQAAALLPGRPNARLAYLNQVTPIRWEQGRLGELRDAWREIVEGFPQSGFGRGWLALASAELGRDDDARMFMRRQVEELPDLPRGGLWPAALAVASLAAAHLEDPEAAQRIYGLLRPYAERTLMIPMPQPVMCFGSAEFFLGVLAATGGRWDEAADHFESALRANAALGAGTWLARTRLEYARTLIRRGRPEEREQAAALLDRAEAAAQELGLPKVLAAAADLRAVLRPAAPDVSDRSGGADAGANVFRREGDYWSVAYEGRLIRLRDTKGLRLLARLLANPGREFHVVDLESAETPGDPGRSRVSAGAKAAGLETRVGLGDAGEVLDERAKAEYKQRLDDLRSDLDEAEQFNDPGRAAQIKQEIDFLARELARAVGLRGRNRKAASHAERARLNVTRAIKAALENIVRGHPALGLHLRTTIRTGTYCSYTPDPRTPITWDS